MSVISATTFEFVFACMERLGRFVRLEKICPRRIVMFAYGAAKMKGMWQTLSWVYG